RDAAPKDAAATDNTAAANDQPNNFQAVRINGDVYAIYSGKYQLIEPGSDVEIPNGYVKSKTILSDISVTVYYPESNPDSDFLLIYAKNDAGEEGFYQYDRVEKTLQRFDPQEITVTQANPTPTSIQTAQQNEYRSNIGKAAVIIALLSVFCALLIVLSIRLYMKLRGFKDDDLD
ncbi:MAG TPA: hypothetical protein VN131_04640, partial [Mobilitalea sp.]|nr:hypothetical protein [Mobilitalea sp.]